MVIGNSPVAESFVLDIGLSLAELGTFEWWISGLMLDPLFFLILRLNNACHPVSEILSDPSCKDDNA